MSAEKILGDEPLIHPNCKLKDSVFGKYTEVGPSNSYENVILGDYSYTQEYCMLQNVVIGKFSNIAAFVRLGPTSHPMERPTMHHFTYRRKMYGFDTIDEESYFDFRRSQVTKIGHDTWIGHGAIVMPGVKVGNGAVIGSGSVVTKDVEPYAIVAGIPAKKIRMRFAPDVVEKLENIAWWDWSHEKIKANLADFCGDIEEFVAKHS